MNKKLLTLILTAGIAVIFVTTGLHAGTEVSDVITMESSIYGKKRKHHPDHPKKPKELVKFTHKAHAEEYKISCGDCHHDDKGQPLDLKMGDDVQKCQECHTQLKNKNKEYVSYKSKPNKKIMVDINRHETALHENCIGCHKKEKIKKGVTCKQCHIPIQ